MTAASEEFMRLVASARGGDREAMDAVVRSVLPDLRAYVRLNVGAHLRALESTSDLVQSVCRDMVEDLGEFEGDARGQFRRWLFTVALRKIQMRHRFHAAKKRDAGRRARAANDEDEGDDALLLNVYESVCTPSRHAAVREELGHVEEAFERLSDDYRQVLTLCCIIGLSHREVAEEMGKAETAVRKLLSRARARLALEIAGASGDAAD